MMLSRLLRQSFLAKTPLFAFSNNSTRTSNTLHSQILQTNSWKDFMSLYENQKEEFNSETVLNTSRHLISMLTRHKDTLDFLNVKELLDTIKNVDTTQIPPKQLISLLSFFRNLAYKGYRIGKNYPVKIQIISAYHDAIKNGENLADDISELLYAYFEMVFWKQYTPASIIAQRILALIDKDPSNQNILTISQTNFLLHVLSIKPVLNSAECKIRKYLLKCLAGKGNTIKVIDQDMQIKDIVTACVDLNKMDILDMDAEEYNNIKIIGEKIIDSLHELEERSIYDFLKGDNISKHHIFTKIYDELLKSIFAEINENGETRMEPESILKMLSLLSNKVSFYRNNQVQRTKYLRFLEHYAREVAQSQDKDLIIQFHSILTNLINNNYFQRSKNNQLLQIVVSTGVKPKFPLVQALFSRGIDVSNFLEPIFSIPSDKLTNAKLINFAVFLNQLNQKKQYQSFKERIQISLATTNKRIQSLFNSEKDFIQLVKDYREYKKEVNVVLFNNIYSKFFEQIPNPLNTEGSDNQYIAAYIQYVINTHKLKDFVQFLNNNEAKLNEGHALRVIVQHVDRDCRQIEPSRKILLMANRQISKLIESKDRSGLYWIIELLLSYNRFAVQGELDRATEALVFKSLHELISNVSALEEIGSLNNLSQMIYKYISRNFKNYNIEANYRDLLVHALSKITFFKKRGLPQLLLQEGFRLNLVSKKVADQIKTRDYALKYGEKIRLEYLKDNTYIPQIKSISIRMLSHIFSNPNLEPFVSDNIAKIKQIISKAHITVACQIITSFNLPINKDTISVIIALLKRIEESESGYDRSDIVGVIQFLNKFNLQKLSPNIKIAAKVMEMAKKLTHMFSLATHHQFIQLISTQSSLNATEYYNYIAHHVKEEYGDYDYDILLYKLSSTNYEPRSEDLNRIKGIVGKELYNGLALFLRYESLLEEAERKEIVKIIVRQLNQKKDPKVLSQLKYNYLKSSYPEQTKDLQVITENLTPLKFSIKPRLELLSVLQKVAEANNVAPENIEFPLIDDNIGYKINGYIILFLTVRSQGAYYEHEFVKRALKKSFEAKGNNYKIVFVGQTKEAGFLQYLNKTVPQLVSDDLFKDLNDKIKERYSSKKQVEEEVE